MELIQPAEISGKIMTLIDQAREELIIISPYNKFTYWKKLTQRINKAKNRGVKIKWYIRKNVENNNVEQIHNLGIEPIEIEDLHCKLYLNEKNAVITSMNLHEYSDSSSIDIGYLITKENHYKELKDFINTYITYTPIMQEYPEEERHSNKSYMECLTDFLSNSGYLYEQYKNNYWITTSIRNFVDDFELIIEPKGSYYRIDLRINYPYRVKCKIFDYLKNKNDILNEKTGHVIDFGTQMKRLKMDLQIFENYQYENWTNKEFSIIKPILEKTINTYKDIINQEVKPLFLLS